MEHAVPAHHLRSKQTQLGLSVWAGILAPEMWMFVTSLFLGPYFVFAAVSNPTLFWVVTASFLIAWSAALNWLLRGSFWHFMSFLFCQVAFAAVGWIVLSGLYQVEVIPEGWILPGRIAVIVLVYPLGWFAGVYLGNKLNRRPS